MDEEPTCGKGLAEHSAIPAKLSELTAALADNLELHQKTIDLTDENARKEHDAYVTLAQEYHRRRPAGDCRAHGRISGPSDGQA